MRDIIDKKKKRGPIISAVVIIAILGIYLAAFLYPVVGEALGDTIGVVFLIVYGLFIVAVIVGVLAALRQRLKEIEGGEEEDAKKY